VTRRTDGVLRSRRASLLDERKMYFVAADRISVGADWSDKHQLHSDSQDS